MIWLHLSCQANTVLSSALSMVITCALARKSGVTSWLSNLSSSRFHLNRSRNKMKVAQVSWMSLWSSVLLFWTVRWSKRISLLNLRLSSLPKKSPKLSLKRLVKRTKKKWSKKKASSQRMRFLRETIKKSWLSLASKTKHLLKTLSTWWTWVILTTKSTTIFSREMKMTWLLPSISCATTLSRTPCSKSKSEKQRIVDQTLVDNKQAKFQNKLKFKLFYN